MPARVPGWSYTALKYATQDDSDTAPGFNLMNLGVCCTPGKSGVWKDTGASYGDTFLHLGAPTTGRLSMQYNF
jgi:iron complex outermembrane receptor protein